MLIGNREQFAVQFEIEDIVDGWVFGRFFLWIHGAAIGDLNDHSVDLKGCLRWLRDIVENPRDCYEPGLYEMHKDQVFLRLASSVLIHEDSEGFVGEFYSNAFSRFHISHIGMSSFDRMTLLFLTNKNGLERLVWKSESGDLMDACFAKGTVGHVFSKSANELEKCISLKELSRPTGQRGSNGD